MDLSREYSYLKYSSTMEAANEKFSLKTLLFTKAIPNYVIPVSTAGHKVYGCTDCGDKFILESSFEYHVNRKSVKITYLCRPCGNVKTFYNRCNLLSHIRSHTFKTATINISDLQIEPLPVQYFKTVTPNAIESTQQNEKSVQSKPTKETKINCIECNTDIVCVNKDTVHRIRAQHYMKASNELYSCPICLFTLPTICALQSHMRFHMKLPPYYCPECGVHLGQRFTVYPYNHNCEGFKMMRTAVRLKCPVAECYIFHPNDYKGHIETNHLKPVYKCPFCYVACFEEPIMEKHLKGHNVRGKALKFYQCQICPGKLVLQNQVESHLKAHICANFMYPCWACGTVFKDLAALLEHHVNAHDLPNSIIKKIIQSLVAESPGNMKQKKVYRVVKRCELCKRSFTYKCKFEQIKQLPSECPYKCSSTSSVSTDEQVESSAEKRLICHLCNVNISQDWEDIKKHYREHHNSHCCVDVKVVLEKLNIAKYAVTKKKIDKTVQNKKKGKKKKSRKHLEIQQDKIDAPTMLAEFTCKICGTECGNKETMKDHILTHRDPCMAYQCMECGQCFVVKPSFSKHLLLEHNISNVENYVAETECYNENALNKYQDPNSVATEPLRENQCKICRDQFENADDFEKHFRVHGMAFLMKKKTNSP